MNRNSKILSKETTALLLIDLQEKIFSVMQNKDALLQNALKLIKGCKVLNIPIYVTEQYPKGLGFTHPEIKEELNDVLPYQKMGFSCFSADNLFSSLKEKSITQVVTAGIEAHVCVQQTVLDLLANGFNVSLAADSVSSRKQFDYETALRRMEKNGAEITTTESILFELLNVCGTPEFKEVSKIIK